MALPEKCLSRLLCGITSNHSNGNYCVYIHLEQKIKIKLDTCYNNPEKLLRHRSKQPYCTRLFFIYTLLYIYYYLTA